MDSKPRYRFSQIPPTRSVRGVNSLSGQTDMEFSVPGTLMAVLDDSYLDMKVILNKTTPWTSGDAASGFALDPSLIDGLAQNVMACYFKTATLYVNDHAFSTSAQYTAHSTMMKLIFSPEDDEKASTSAIYPIQYSDTDYDKTQGGAVPVGQNVNVEFFPVAKTTALESTAYVSIMPLNSKRASLRRRLFRANPTLSKCSVGELGNDLTLYLSLPLMPLFAVLGDSVSEIPGNNKIRLSFQGNPNVHRDLVCSASDSGNIASYTVEYFNWYVPMFENPSGVPVSLSWNTRYLEGFSSLRSHTGDGSYQYSLPSGGVKYVAIAFGHNKQAVDDTAPKVLDINSFEAPFTHVNKTANTPLTNLYVTFAGASYPSPQYIFPNDYTRAYNDYYHLSMAAKLGTSPLLSFSEWLFTPVFVFYTESDAGNDANVLTVHVYGCTTATDMHLLALYEKEASIEYDESGRPVNTLTSFIQ